jgi:molecular chaperone HtpG
MNSEDAATELRTTRVDLGGLLEVLGLHLYSTPAVALRELVQNAHDSCVRRRLEDPAAAELPGRIVVSAQGNVLRIEDEGAGLTRDEIHDFLATVGSGYTRKLREAGKSDELIGLFGLGFLSAFVVAERVTVHTTSYRAPDAGFRYQSRGGERYSVEETAPRAIGTLVELELHARHTELAAPDTLRHLLGRYCALLHVPVWLAGDDVALNAEVPPWRVADEHPLRARARRTELASRFERRFSPICTMDVTAGEGSDVAGLLWVQDGSTYGTSDKPLRVGVRARHVDRRRRAGALAPLGGLRGRHRGVQRAHAHREPRGSAAGRGLRRGGEAHRRRAGAWARRGRAHAARGLPPRARAPQRGAARRRPRRTPRVRPARPRSARPDQRGRAHRGDAVSPRRGQGLRLARPPRRLRGDGLSRPADPGRHRLALRRAAVSLLRRWAERRGGTVLELGTADGNRAVLHPAPLAPAESALLTELLAGPHHLVVGARFAPRSLPLVVIPDREVELKKRIESDEADKRIAGAALRLARLGTAKLAGTVEARIYVNLDCPAIARLVEAARRGERPVRAGKLLRALVALLAGSADGASVDLEPALATITDTVTWLIGAERRDESEPEEGAS